MVNNPHEDEDGEWVQNNGQWTYLETDNRTYRVSNVEMTFTADTTTSPSDVLESVAQTVDAKNDDYGSAIEKNAVIKRVLAADDVVVRTDDDGTEWVQLGDHDVADLEQQRLDGIFTRLLDKVARLYTLSFTEQTDSVGEKRRDTVEDLLGYLAHAAVDGIDWDD